MRTNQHAFTNIYFQAQEDTGHAMRQYMYGCMYVCISQKWFQLAVPCRHVWTHQIKDTLLPKNSNPFSSFTYAFSPFSCLFLQITHLLFSLFGRLCLWWLHHFCHQITSFTTRFLHLFSLLPPIKLPINFLHITKLVFLYIVVLQDWES